MMLNEIQVADRLGISQGIAPIAIKRRVRKIIEKVGIEPYIIDRAWLIPEEMIEVIKIAICPLRSKNVNSRTAQLPKLSGCAVQSRAKRYSEALEKRRNLKQNDLH